VGHPTQAIQPHALSGETQERWFVWFVLIWTALLIHCGGLWKRRKLRPISLCKNLYCS